jgi:hypothetical protein
MKKFIFFKVLIIFSVSLSHAQTWTYEAGYAAGKQYCEQNRGDIAEASINYANSIGENNYANGIGEGFVYGCNKLGSYEFNISKCFLEFIRGGISAYNECTRPGMDNTTNSQPRIMSAPESIDKIDISVFPNPTTSVITFVGENLNNCKVSIFNSFGNSVIKNSKINQSIDLEKEKNGIYVYIITDDSGYRKKGKIIKK